MQAIAWIAHPVAHLILELILEQVSALLSGSKIFFLHLFIFSSFDGGFSTLSPPQLTAVDVFSSFPICAVESVFSRM
jgi:hypothetical protein